MKMTLNAFNTARVLLIYTMVSTAQGQTFLQGIDLREQIRTVAITILSEAKGESDQGKRAVAQTILNRARKRHTSAYEECLRPKQFSWWNTPRIEYDKRKMMQDSNADFAEYLATEIIRGVDVLPNFGASNFHSGHPPYWAKSMKFLAKIGGHSFYIE